MRAELFAAFASRPAPQAGEIVRPGAEAEADRLRDGLSATSVHAVTVADVNNVFEGRLLALTPKAFLYYLPALMDISLQQYSAVSVFASGLVGALTRPSRYDVVASLE